MIKNFKLQTSNRGQVAIIVLLVSAVMLTLGLTMSNKEIISVKINTNDELLKKAFDTAESGINYYLGTGGTSYVSPDNSSFANVAVSKIGDGSNKIDFGEFVLAGSNENYWLVNHLENGNIGSTFFAGPNIDVCGVGFTGSIEISYFYKNGASYGVKRFGYNFGGSIITGFENKLPGCVNITMIGSPILLSVMPIYNGGKFYIEAKNGGSFASQGIDILSDGTSGGTNTKLNIRQRYKLPSFMTSGMMAEGSILSD